MRTVCARPGAMHCMEKLSILFVFITALYVASPTCVAQAAKPTQISRAGKPDCTKVKFHRLNQYSHQGWARLFRDREVTKVLRPLLGKDYRLLIENMQQVSYSEDSLSLVDRKGVLTLRGFVPGLFTISEAMLIVEPCGKIYTAILDQGERFLYFSNDKEYLDRLPAAIEQWRNSIEEVRNRPERKAPLPIEFKSK